MDRLEKENVEIETVPPQMVPALAKLITALRASNLTEEEFMEIAKQLESNKNSEPRENTSPSGPRSDVDEVEQKEKTETEKQKEEAANRNLAALRRALNSSDSQEKRTTARRAWAAQDTAPVRITLQRPKELEEAMRSPKRPAPRAYAVTPFPHRIIPQNQSESDSLIVENFVTNPPTKEMPRTTESTLPPPNANHVHVPPMPKVRTNGPLQGTSGVWQQRQQSQSQTVQQPTATNARPVAVSGVVQQPQQVVSQPNYQQQTAYYNYYQQQQQQQPQWPQQQQQPYYYYNNNYPYQYQSVQYNYQQQQQQQPQQSQQNYYTAAPQRPFSRMFPDPPITTPAATLAHPESHGTLLTLPQQTYLGRKR
jgi:hypothetical protein